MQCPTNHTFAEYIKIVKYWLLTTEYPPFYGGGISTYCFFTAKMLSEKGHSVTVFVPDNTLSADVISESDHIRLVRFAINKSGMDSNLGYNALVSYELAITIREYLNNEAKPDIVEVQDYQGLGYYLHLFKKLGYENFRDLCTLTTLHSTALLYQRVNREAIYKFPTFWVGEMEKFAILASDILISPSQYLVDRLAEDFRINDREVIVIPNPILSTSPLKDTSFERNNIVFFGKMVYTKGGFQLIEYFKKLWNQGFAHPLTIIGDADFALHTEDMLARDFINKKYGKFVESGLLVLTGKLKSQEIRKYLEKAHVVVIPSLVDNLPYTVLETMLEGKLVLASKQGGHVEVIENGVDGFLFDHNQPSTFFEQLEKVLSLSDEEIYTIGRNAHSKIINGYNFETIYAQKMQVIENYKSQPAVASDIFPYIRPIPLTAPTESLALNNDKRGLVSVVIPYYNLGKLVEETIESVLQSTYEKLEILVVDDGSTDPVSIATLDNLKKAYPTVRVLHKPNGGLGHTRNYGAAHASGEYLAILDADDTIHPSYYEKAVRVLEQYENVHFVGCWCKYFEGNKGYWVSNMPEPPFFLIHNTMNSSALIFRKASFLQAGNDTEMSFQGLEDWECIVNMTSKGLTGASLPEPLFNYRVRKNSMFRQISKVQSFFLHSYIVNKHAAFYSKYTADIVNILNSNGSGINLDNPTREAFGSFSSRIVAKLKRIISRNYYLKKYALKLKKLLGK
ncbi:glycosyltransferase [Pseudoflavitalea rhizosphaerae]|uniref:glycosyltransferase n=1 Tax=Pseudoflavitalea rhizosphaerae TaxID=1884793 RepID=UPI000F8C89B4|nr:glycosyltransferase [Pseudoflavitalea rhizosphaerae]